MPKYKRERIVTEAMMLEHLARELALSRVALQSAHLCIQMLSVLVGPTLPGIDDMKSALLNEGFFLCKKIRELDGMIVAEVPDETK